MPTQDFVLKKKRGDHHVPDAFLNILANQGHINSSGVQMSMPVCPCQCPDVCVHVQVSVSWCPYPCSCPSVRPGVCVPVSRCPCPGAPVPVSVSMSRCPGVCVPVSMSQCLCPSVRIPVSIPVSISPCPSVHVPLSRCPFHTVMKCHHPSGETKQLFSSTKQSCTAIWGRK
uniref:Uncharacterized protein n=1 Tax=Cyanistes caeruleus TaxID=156563 RepID=A0A8C0ZIN7_CYACU